VSLFKRKISKLSDNELITLYQKELSQTVLSGLYSRYAHLVYGVSLKYLKNEAEAKDMTQEVYEVLLKKLKTHEINNFKSWLYQLTKNECLMFLRKNKRIEFVSAEHAPEAVSDHSLLDEKRLLEVKIDVLSEALENLKSEQKHCIELFYLKKLSYKQIAESTTFSEKEIKSYIQNGKRNLKNQLMNHAEFRTEERHTRTA